MQCSLSAWTWSVVGSGLLILFGSPPNFDTWFLVHLRASIWSWIPTLQSARSSRLMNSGCARKPSTERR